METEREISMTETRCQQEKRHRAEVFCYEVIPAFNQLDKIGSDHRLNDDCLRVLSIACAPPKSTAGAKAAEKNQQKLKRKATIGSDFGLSAGNESAARGECRGVQSM